MHHFKRIIQSATKTLHKREKLWYAMSFTCQLPACKITSGRQQQVLVKSLFKSCYCILTQFGFLKRRRLNQIFHLPITRFQKTHQENSSVPPPFFLAALPETLWRGPQSISRTTPDGLIRRNQIPWGRGMVQSLVAHIPGPTHKSLQNLVQNTASLSCCLHTQKEKISYGGTYQGSLVRWRLQSCARTLWMQWC